MIRVVLIEPAHELNIGHVARAMANFGFRELFLVKPKVKIGRTARKFAKHGAGVLDAAKAVRSFGEAVRGCNLVVGTTGILRREKGTIRNPITPRAFAKKIAAKKGKIALIFGREGTGLNAREIGACDFLVTIPANPAYQVLNISHAAAVLLYELSCAQNLRRTPMMALAAAGEKGRLLGEFGALTDELAPQLRNPEKIKLAFKRVVGRAAVSDLEARALLGLLGRIRRRIGERKRATSSSQS